MRDNLPNMLRSAAKEWREENKVVATGATRYDAALEEAAEAIESAMRPVVLCKDCKHKGWVQEPEHGKSVDYCRLIERCVDKQFFCAAGERKPTA